MNVIRLAVSSKTNWLVEWPFKLALALVIVASALIGWQGTYWGQPYAFHSDEWRYLSRVVTDPAVPIWTIYGRWPIYFQQIAASLTGIPLTDVILARQVTLLVSLSGLIMTALAARQLAGWKGALTATALLAGAPLIVQTANFFITDVWLYTGVAASLWLCLRQVSCSTWLNSILLAVVWGIAIGSKLSGLFLLPMIVLAFLLSDRRQRWHRFTLVIGLATGVALLGQPTMLLKGLQAYLYEGQLVTHLNVAAGVIRPVYSLQFANTPPWIYYLVPVLWWSAGPVLLLAGCGGAAWAIYRIVSRFRTLKGDRVLSSLLLILVALGSLYFFSAGQYAKYARYALPLLPPLALLASWSVCALVERFPRPLASASLTAFIAASLVPGLMFAPIHRQQDTRLQAAEWIGENIPAGSVICHEPDIGYAVPPIGLGGPAYSLTADKQYQGVLLDWGELYYSSDYLRRIEPTYTGQQLLTKEEQAAKVESWLSRCDWIILSDRFADQFLPLPDDLPAISRFYRAMLGNEQSGFQQVAIFRSLPRLLDFTIDDRSSELTFRSFDHPTIWIFHRMQA